MNKKINIVDVLVDPLNEDEALNRLIGLSDSKENGYVCFVNAHSIVTAQSNSDLRKALDSSSINCPDGISVSKLMNFLGAKSQRRVGGPDFMLRLCSVAEVSNKRIFLFGNTQSTLDKLQAKILSDYPSLNIVGSISPPFRELSEAENNEFIKRINDSGADFVFVSLGCPKQEIWMNHHCLKLDAISLGFGAAFDFYSGNIIRAPVWMRENGLEWLHRLISDPRRLWKRYLVTNTLYIWFSLKQLIKIKIFGCKN